MAPDTISCVDPKDQDPIVLAQLLKPACSRTLEAGAALNTFLNKKSQVEKYYQALQYLQETRALVTLWTGRRKYKNMLLKSLSTTVDYKSANSMVIDITARQIIMVTTDVVSLKGDAAAISKRGQQYLNAATRAGG